MLDIPKIDYKDWYINQSRIPDKQSTEYKKFFNFHKRLCLDGCYMEGEYINPFLMWHLNFWHTEIDVVDERGRIGQKYHNPLLRDNEWLVTNEIDRAHKEQKGLVILGLRRFAKSVIEASYIAWGATFDENSQNIIAGLNSSDIKLITDKLDKGLNFIPEAWRWQRVEDNWKSQVTLGIKTKSGERIPFSQILVRNLDEGLNEEAIAGTKPRKLIIDEIGKGRFLRGLQAAVPGFTTPYGWTCSPILTGTGGDMKKFADAKTLMFDVDSFNFLVYNNSVDQKRTHGLYLSYRYRMEAKEQSSLGQFLNKPLNSSLYKVPMLVSNEEKAKKITDDNLNRLKRAGDRIAYLKEKMYYPIEVDDIFLSEDVNIFDIEIAKRQKFRLQEGTRMGTPVILVHDGEKIVHEFTDKQPITNFPLRPNDLKDAPVVIYEFPVENPPYGLYVAGVDNYRQGQAKYSSSLGSVYIYKRMNSLTGEKFQDMFVASYCARPEKKETWEEQARLLIKYYNARTLCENDDISFIEYMKAKGDAHYLEKQPEWLMEIVPNTTAKREYGIHRSAQKIIDFLHGCLKKYMEEVIYTEKDENGAITRELLGITKIFDPVLLEEIIQYDDEGNFDRIVACFVENSMILTESGYKPIQDIVIGDRVLSHKGRYKTVTNTSKVKKLNEGLIEIKPLGYEKSIICTKDHPFLTSTVKKGKGRSYRKNTTIGQLEWRTAEELSLNDYLLIPKRKELTVSPIHKEFLYILGWYLSDGHRSRNNIRITFQSDQLHIAEYINSLLLKHDAFDEIYVTAYNHLAKRMVTGYRDRKKPRIYKIKNKNAYNLEFNCTEFNKLIDDHILILKGGEKIIKDSLFNCSNLLPLVLGILEGDGHQKSTFAKGSINPRETVEISGTYQTLIHQVRQILFDNDIWSTENLSKQKKPNAKMQLRIDIQDQKGLNKIFRSITGNSKKFRIINERPQRMNHRFIEKGILVPIKKLQKLQEENVIVYNLTVDEDNSYTVSSFAVHNCELAIAQALKMDPIIGRIGSADVRVKAMNRKVANRLFTPSGSISRYQRKLFT